LKEENDLEVERRADGRLFHAHGPTTANARSPIDARHVGVGTVPRDRRLTLNGADDITDRAGVQPIGCGHTGLWPWGQTATHSPSLSFNGQLLIYRPQRDGRL